MGIIKPERMNNYLCKEMLQYILCMKLVYTECFYISKICKGGIIWD